MSRSALLLVDDEKFSQITMLRLLKNIGDPVTHSASNGLEAMDVLESRRSNIHCVISDFNMPIMHGLQLLKAIRTGQRGIPRTMPVLMLTAHGEPPLVHLALALDVNGFVLKPAKKESMEERLHRILEDIQDEEPDWLKPVDEYGRVDVDSSIADILKFKQLSDIKLNKPKIKHDKSVACTLDTVNEGDILARPLVTQKGNVLMNAGQPLRADVIKRLKDLSELNIEIGAIWIREKQ